MAHYNQKETAEWRKTYDLQPGGRLEISNINGKIDVEPSAGNAVEIVAEKSARAASSEAAKEALGRIEIQENRLADKRAHRNEGAAQYRWPVQPRRTTGALHRQGARGSGGPLARR